MPLEELFIPETPVWELVARGIVIYFALMLAFRLIGKREFGQLGAFDLILLLIISEAISPAINADDRAVTAGLIVAATLFVVNYLMGWAQFRSPALKKVLSGEAEELIRDGRPDQQVMNRERMSVDDIVAELRLKGIDGLDKVRLGYLEDNGSISALLRQEPSNEQHQASTQVEQERHTKAV